MTKQIMSWLERDEEKRNILIQKYLARTKKGNGDEEEASRIKAKKLAQEAYERNVGDGIPENAEKVYSQQVPLEYVVSDYNPSYNLNKFREASVYNALKQNAFNSRINFDYIYKTPLDAKEVEGDENYQNNFPVQEEIPEEEYSVEQDLEIPNNQFQKPYSEVLKKKIIKLKSEVSKLKSESDDLDKSKKKYFRRENRKVIKINPKKQHIFNRPSLEKTVASENKIDKPKFFINSPTIKINKPKIKKHSLDNLVESNDDSNFGFGNYEPAFKFSKEDKNSLKYGFLSGLAPVIDPLGYISSLFYRQRTGIEFKDKNSMGTVFNKIYGKVYENKSEAPYIPKAFGTLAGFGVASGSLVALSFVNPLIGIAIPVLTGLYSIYKTIKKVFDKDKKVGENKK